MMQLIEFIFSNPLFIIILLGLINFLTSKGKNKEQEKKPRRVEQRKVERESTNKHVPPVREHIPKVEIEKTVQHVEQDEPLTIEELRQKQLERLTSEIQGISEQKLEKDHQDRSDKVKAPEVITQHSNSKGDMEHRLKDQLTKKGLVQSVIMAEVLGPPRAMKRYENIHLRRFHKDV